MSADCEEKSLKLTLIGGGGVRAPEFTRGALAYAALLDLHELWLMDTDADRLRTIHALCNEIVRGSPLRVFATTDLDQALQQSGAVVTTIRVGGERGRVLDERIALRHGVLGQETTGAGGLAMAMRSIPAIMGIAERMETLCPSAYLFNFTNPAGLVVQSLVDAGFRRVVGICDSANSAQHAVAKWAGIAADDVKSEVYGLNHLSWARAAWVNDRDLLPVALAGDAFLHETTQHLFDPHLVRRKGTFLNEYLYYWYYRDVALKKVAASSVTRGEEVEMLSRTLYAQLRELPPADGLAAYDAYNARRSSTYMAYGDGAQTAAQAHEPNVESVVDGYAGVALKTLTALTRKDKTLNIALNVPNADAIPALRPDDVVEVSCRVNSDGIDPLPMGDIPEDDALLMQCVKRYERLAVEAIQLRNCALAVDALVAHPLVASYPTATALVDDYVDAHSAYVGSWN
jgi:6-phospho-beta-glucosidase